ncbi:MAG: nucleotide exchange factor GrpE [Candidatus Saccharibacteria bacterium]
MSKAKKQNHDELHEELAREVAALTEALQRERADAINIRRRHDEQIAQLRTTIKASVIEEMLPALDNFERALKHVPADLEGNDYIKGVQGVVKQFESTLKDLGVERIKTIGETFNPNIHEAVSADGEGESETISEELQAGYVVGDRVIRHAMVKVSRK